MPAASVISDVVVITLRNDGNVFGPSFPLLSDPALAPAKIYAVINGKTTVQARALLLSRS